jgi:hypothetical protein
MNKIQLFTTPMNSEVLIGLTIFYVVCEAISIFDTRIIQAKKAGFLRPDVSPVPEWTGWFAILGWLTLIGLVLLNWKFTIMVYIITFFLKVVPVLENIGALILLPVVGKETAASVNIMSREYKKSKSKFNDMIEKAPQKTSLPAEKDATLSVVQHQNEAEQGHDMAQFRPEACYVQGEGVPKDNVQAVADMISNDTAMRIIDGFFVYYQNKNRPDFFDENDIGIKLDTFWRCLKIYRDFLEETKSKKLEFFLSLTDRLECELVKEIDPLDKVFLHQRDSNTKNYFILYVKYKKISKEDNSSYIEKYGF